MADKDVLGRAGENRAALYLTEAGYQLIDRNWRCSQGELDIVAVRGNDAVVVEVKTRRTDGFGHPFEAIDPRKRARLWKLAMAWAGAHPEWSRGRVMRVDAIALTGPDPATAELEHIEDVR